MTRPAATATQDLRFAEEALSYAPSLYGAALRNTRNRADAEDLVQDTYLRAFRARESFEDGTNLKAWLFKILINLYISGYHRQRRQPVLVSTENLEDFDLYRQVTRYDPETLKSAERIVLEGLIDEDIKGAVAALPERFRMPVLLADVEGFSYREIADMLEIPIGTVMSRLHRGRKALQKALWGWAADRGLVRSEQV
ncbi:MAG: sigma-70 family RNA polymerase sigma factor [Actinomycetota bacterium]